MRRAETDMEHVKEQTNIMDLEVFVHICTATPGNG